MGNEIKNTDRARKQAIMNTTHNRVVIKDLICPLCKGQFTLDEVKTKTGSNGTIRICPSCKKEFSMQQWAMAAMKHKFNKVTVDNVRQYSAVTMSNRIFEFNKYIADLDCKICGAKAVVATLKDDEHAVLYCDACGHILFEDTPDTDIIMFRGIPINAILKHMKPQEHEEIIPEEPVEYDVDASEVPAEVAGDIITDVPEEAVPETNPETVSLTLVQRLIGDTCDEVKELLIEKNRKYGNSALEPVRIFSKADPVEAIKVRIDDKISRLRNEQNDEDEDVVKDLMGYLVLLQVAKKMKGETK